MLATDVYKGKHFFLDVSKVPRDTAYLKYHLNKSNIAIRAEQEILFLSCEQKFSFCIPPAEIAFS